VGMATFDSAQKKTNRLRHRTFKSNVVN
jgi:hypothetical protein